MNAARAIVFADPAGGFCVLYITINDKALAIFE